MQMTQKGAILAIMPVSISKEELEGTKEVIRIGNGRRRDNTIAKRKRTKGQTTIYKAQKTTDLPQVTDKGYHI